MFQISDKVKTLGVLSPVVTGTIYAVLHPDTLEELIFPGQDMTTWYEKWPDWKTKPIYLLKKDLPELAWHPEEIEKAKLVYGEQIVELYMKDEIVQRWMWISEYELEAFDWIDDVERNCNGT